MDQIRQGSVISGERARRRARGHGSVLEGVGASAVIGIMDEKSGEVPVVYIELEEGKDHLNEAGLKRYMREQLANYKIPKQIHVIDELPKNATGKVLKRALKEKLKDAD